MQTTQISDGGILRGNCNCDFFPALNLNDHFSDCEKKLSFFCRGFFFVDRNSGGQNVVYPSIEKMLAESEKRLKPKIKKRSLRLKWYTTDLCV